MRTHSLRPRSATPYPLPEKALLVKYRDASRPGAARTYTDCYAASVEATVDLADFVFAFYTTPVFRLERLILKYLASRPSTDEQARALARGSTTAFAAWDVEDRRADQLLMCDLHQRTRSWFMVAPADNRSASLLLFGSAVVPVEGRANGEWSLGKGYQLLLGFHKLSSRILLNAARRRLSSSRNAGFAD